MTRKHYTNADLKWHPAWDKLVGPKPPDDFVSNGASGAPDILFGHDLTPACHLHDWHYSFGCVDLRWPRDEQARYEADQYLRENLIRCELGPKLADIYYYRVRLWGHLYFAYSPGHEPKRTLWFWLRLLFGRYVTW